MRRQRALALLASALSLLGTNAWAQDYGLPAFAGAYLGVAVGAGAQQVTVDNNTLGTSFDDTQTGFTVGGYAGYNWVMCCSRFLFGVEADLNWLNTSPTALDIETGPTGLHENTLLNSQLNWFGTVRARFGAMVHENWLIYATGGLAYGQIDHKITDDCVGCGNSPFNLGPFQQSDTDTGVGWTLGGGTEFLHDGSWFFRAEALYVDLGSQNHTYLVTAPPLSAVSATEWQDQFWVARVGVSYAFGELDP